MPPRAPRAGAFLRLWRLNKCFYDNDNDNDNGEEAHG